jgi:hypothetical protein
MQDFLVLSVLSLLKVQLDPTSELLNSEELLLRLKQAGGTGYDDDLSDVPNAYVRSCTASSLDNPPCWCLLLWYLPPPEGNDPERVICLGFFVCDDAPCLSIAPLAPVGARGEILLELTRHSLGQSIESIQRHAGQ